MAARKFAADFESLTNKSANQQGLWADLSDCKQIDYGIVKASGTITAGVVELVSRQNENQSLMRVGEFDLSTMAFINTRGFQSSEPKPNGAQFAWIITTPIVGGTITCFINGQHS